MLFCFWDLLASKNDFLRDVNNLNIVAAHDPYIMGAHFFSLFSRRLAKAVLHALRLSLGLSCLRLILSRLDRIRQTQLILNRNEVACLH